jgi:hypothetical protein
MPHVMGLRGSVRGTASIDSAVAYAAMMFLMSASGGLKAPSIEADHLLPCCKLGRSAGWEITRTPCGGPRWQ